MGDSPRSPRRPWSAVPDRLADSLRPALPGAIEHVIAVVTSEVPAYSSPNQRIAATLREGVGLALSRLLALMGTDDEALDGSAEVYQRIGAGEYRAGRGLGDLLSAYQIGARAAWQSMSRAGVEAGVTPGDVALLAEAVFAYIDQLSGASIAGYAREQVADTGRREQLRSALIARILAGDRGAERFALADQVGWRLPGTVMVAIPRGDDLPEAIPGALSARTAQGAVALIPGPLTQALRRWLERADLPVAVGPEVPLAEAARSARLARSLRRLGHSGTLMATDHLPDLLLSADPVLARELRDTVLAPFEGLPPARRDALLTTLRSWLLHAGNRIHVAEALHVHPQSVSYRMDRVRELLPDRLEDPRARWELLLALMVDAQAVPNEPD